MLELDADDRRLDLVEPAVEPDLFVMITHLAAMVPQAQQMLCKIIIICDHHASVAVSAEVLAREKAEAAKITDSAGLFPMIFGAKGLRAILDDLEAVLFCEFHKPIHVSGLSIKMHRE